MDVRRAVCRDDCMGVYTGDRVDVCRAVRRDIRMGVCMGGRADDYRAFLVYQCCVLVEL